MKLCMKRVKSNSFFFPHQLFVSLQHCFFFQKTRNTWTKSSQIISSMTAPRRFDALKWTISKLAWFHSNVFTSHLSNKDWTRTLRLPMNDWWLSTSKRFLGEILPTSCNKKNNYLFFCSVSVSLFCVLQEVLSKGSKEKFLSVNCAQLEIGLNDVPAASGPGDDMML